VQYVFNVGAGLIAARLNHTFRDIEQILPFVFRLLFYGSGVLFYVGAYVEDPTLRWFFYINPVFCILTLYRWSVLGMPADMIEVASLGIWTIAVLLGGLWWFRRGEASYGN
jgi:teichoic acid transport system permease protein